MAGNRVAGADNSKEELMVIIAIITHTQDTNVFQILLFKSYLIYTSST